MRPDHGGKVELRLERSSESAVGYAGTLATPDGEWETRATIEIASGEVKLELEGAPDWLVDFARNVLRALWRTRESSGWPRRITRWRADPEAR